MYGVSFIILYYNQQIHNYIITVYAVEPLLSGLRLTVNSINRASHRCAVPVHFQCAGEFVSG
jgi:hypothetical protein